MGRWLDGLIRDGRRTSGGCHIDIRRAWGLSAVHFFGDLLSGVFEFADTSSHASCELRDFLSSEKQQENQHDNDDFAITEIEEHKRVG